MKMKTILSTLSLCGALLASSLNTASAQTLDTWTGASGGEWNDGANWSTTAPPLDSTTNAFIGSGITVNYLQPMAAVSFGNLTNFGTLNINTNGFNCSGIYVNLAGSTVDTVNITNVGAVVNDFGAFLLGTNGQATLGAGASLTCFSLAVAGSTSSHAAGTSTFTNNGGAFNSTSSSVGSAGNTDTGRLVINGGTNNLGKVSVGRYNGGSASTLGTEGLAIYGGIVTMTNLNCNGNSYGSVYIAGGTVTNFGNVYITNGTAGRYMRVVQAGGLFVVPDPGIIYENNAAAAGGETARYQVTGGTNFVGGFYLGSSNSTIAGTVTATIAAPVYVGSQGINSNGAVAYTFSLNSGGKLGATTAWTNFTTITLGGGSVDCEDPSGTPQNIFSYGSMNGGILTKTGGGTLTLAGANSCSGVNINAGTTALSANIAGVPASFSSSLTITVATNTTLDVSQLSSLGGFVLGSSKTIAGVGTVAGTFAAGPGGVVSPAGAGVQGTINFANGLAATNANFNMELSYDTTGTVAANDAVNVTGDLTASGTNIIVATPVGSLGIGTYTLIKYSGNFNGGITNFACAAGTLTNPPGEIDLIVTVVRPVANLAWNGDGSANLWNTAGASNWLNGATLDRFYTGDTNNFTDNTTNFMVNVSGIVAPAPLAAVIVNATNNYTFADAGGGDITGTTGLTKTNAGKLTILMTNDYTGITTIGGGTLSVSNLANGSSPSPIGAAGNSSANVVFTGGALEYLGGNATVNRGATLQTGGGTLSIVNSNTTLTLSGNWTGPGALTKIDNGQLTLSGANDYSGGTTISAGSIRLNPAGTLGSGAVTLNGGTNSSSAVFLFAGDSQTLNNTLNVVGTNNYLAVNGNDTIGASAGTGTVFLNSAASGNILTIQGVDSTGFNGTFYMNVLNNIRFFPSSGTTLNASNATFNLGGGTGVLYNRDGGSYTLGALFGGTGTALKGSANSGSAATTYYIGGNNLSSTFSGTITTGAGGTGASVNLVKIGTGTFTLDGGYFTNIYTPDGFSYVTNIYYTNLVVYSGSTVVSNGVLALVAPVLLTHSSSVTLSAATAVLDASQMGYISNQYDSDGITLTNQIIVTNSLFEVVSGKTLAGIGTLNGNLLARNGSTLNVGLPLGSLTVTNNAELAGAVSLNVSHGSTPNASELVANSFVIDGTATLTVNNVGSALQSGDAFQLFSGPVTNFASVTLPSVTGSLSISNKLAIDGSIVVIGSGVNTNSTNITFSVVGGNNLVLSWPNDHQGWGLQMQVTNLTAGLSPASNAWINIAGASTNTAYTNTITTTNGAVFFRMIYPPVIP